MIAALLAALLAVATIAMPPVIGQWSGYMTRDGDRLDVRFDFSDAPTPRGTFSATDLGALDIPLERIRLGKTVHWELVGDTTSTVFDGELNGSTISGSFSDNGHAGTFLLHRVAASERPYEKRGVTFRNGDVQLAGSLFLPRTSGEHPALLFVQGSGDEGRWASAYLADYAARHGIVGLAYDKRGVGASAGNWRTSTMEDLVNDARAGIKLLSRTPGVDRKRIGVYGHSQGGQLAPAIAQDNELVSFVIAADGPVGPQYLQDIFRVDNFLALRYSGKELADAERLYREFVDVARTGASHERLRDEMRAAGNAPWLRDLQIPDDGNWIWSWYKQYGNYDNRAAWAKVRVPVLILFGGKDALVPVQPSIAQTTSILNEYGNVSIAVRVFDNADHTLHVPPPSPGGWPHLPGGFPDVITTFIQTLLGP